MPRALLLVLDSFGCGGAPDAGYFGDAGADTLGHIATAASIGKANRPGLRTGPLRLPFLDGLGLGRAAALASGRLPPGLTHEEAPRGAFGYGVEVSKGKDTPSGHWEIAGAPVDFAWGYFPDTRPSFPPELSAAIIREGDLPGILGDCHASGTQIIEDLGAEHLRTGMPIVYTSVDSVLQIAAHEEAFGLDRLYDLCRVVRRLCDPLRIGRVIARPFTGDAPGHFQRTANRKDFAMPPPQGNLLDRAAEAGRAVVSIGKIGDIFAHRNTGQEIKGFGHADLIDKTMAALEQLPDGGLIFANYLDLDSEFGHRRDVPGAAACLEDFDIRMERLATCLQPGDLCVITGDHGNDPTWRGTDHTRECTPILAFGPTAPTGPLGRRATFADTGATLAKHLGLAPPLSGRSWWWRFDTGCPCCNRDEYYDYEEWLMSGVTVVGHPLVQHKLTLMRDKACSTKSFRQLVNEVGMLLCYEVTRDLPLENVSIETPLTEMQAPMIAGKKLVFAPILRAGRRPFWRACSIWCPRPGWRISAFTAIPRRCRP